MIDKKIRKTKHLVVIGISIWLSVGQPVAVLAADNVDAVGNSTGAPECTGAGCSQGSGQGADQGADQGGSSLEDLGGHYDESGEAVLPDGVEDIRQGASNGIDAGNSNTGADSDNSSEIDASSSESNSVANTVDDRTEANLTGSTGENSQSKNTGAGGISTGDAGIGVTQIKNDNTAVINGTAGLNVIGHQGDYNEDLNLNFGPGTTLGTGQTSGELKSVRAVNDKTGANSDNSVSIDTKTEELNEVQNDGRIDNILDLSAITGFNEANKNTGDGAITTGDASVAATLVNLLNTTVIDGDIWVTVADIFGDLDGDIQLPDLAFLASSLTGAGGGMEIDVVNEGTGSQSDNNISINVSDEETTDIYNEAEINTTVNATAITGQNDTVANTGGGVIETGDASVEASSLSIANTTVEGGSWGLVVVNALNRWLGFLVGESGEVRALSQEETIDHIEAGNRATGSESDNDVDIDLAHEKETTVANDAVINNEITATAITGQNEANKNTGQGKVDTGDALVEATTINIANTTVKDGSLFIAVVNVLGDWWGDLLYGDESQSLLAASGGPVVEMNGENSQTGAGSENTVDVEVNNSQETNISNEAEVTTILYAEVDTGSNRANRNTLGGEVLTGDGELALHARTIANLTGISLDPVLGLKVTGLNEETGFESKNKIRARLNDERLVSIDNYAQIDNLFWALGNTGNNEANQNTTGGNVMTGDLIADVGIDNLINQVMQALGGGSIEIEVELHNLLTGAGSDNNNDVDSNYDLLVELANDGLVNNLIDLLLNTGRNTANENTGGGEIFSGAGCVEGDIHNEVNKTGLRGLGGYSLDMDSNGEVNNKANFDVNTGENETNRNTGLDGGDGQAGRCGEKIAAVVPSEDGVGGGGDEGESGDGGDDGDDSGSDGEVAGASDVADSGGGDNVVAVGRVNGPVGGKNILTRFPVAGGGGLAVWLPAESRSSLWPLLVVSVLIVLTAYQFDRQAQQQKLRLSLIS